jgi:pyruvate formate lyase activating enzyme
VRLRLNDLTKGTDNVDISSDNGVTGLVFDIQRYSLDDGPGIRTTVFFKGCPLSCAWCQNPESIDSAPEIGFRAERCIDCRACFEACPRGAIVVEGAQRIDLNRCNACGDCTGVCPTKSLFLVGRRYGVSELLEEVQRDAAFYEESGGGVTLSGGEPMMQFEFTLEFLKACKEAGLNTAIETNGLATRHKFLAALPYLDHIYFDLKIMDPAEHRRLAGVDNGHILDNARFLVEAGAPVCFRFPTVPQMTANAENVRAVADFLTELAVTEIELCPYHENWLNKLSWLQSDRSPQAELLQSLSEEEMVEVVAIFSDMGIQAKSKEMLINNLQNTSKR